MVKICFTIILLFPMVLNMSAKGFPIDEIERMPFTEIAKEAILSVVSIQSTMLVKTGDVRNQRLDRESLQNFFGEQYRNYPIPQEFQQTGFGSGLLVSDKGHILTNVHVIENAEQIEVSLSDNRSFSAEIIGIDPMTELAVIKIDDQNLPFGKLGDSDSCEIGEWVLAIGNPLGLNSSVTAGIISAKGREINIILDTYGVENFIQTDAAINPGNSGGPLVNMKGEVIGITTAIATENGYSQGYGFAIPINLAKDILDDFIQHGRIIRGYLGISMQEIDEKKARALGLKRPAGVFIDAVAEDGPAWRSGLLPKDILIKIDHLSVNTPNGVQSIISGKDPGDEISLNVIRKNKILKFKVTLTERTYKTVLPRAKRERPNYRYLGLTVENPTNKLASHLGYKKDSGVIVTAVERFSPAYEAAIRINDVILEIGDIAISSTDTFKTIMDSLKQGEVIILKIKRKDTIFHSFVETPP